MLRVTIELVPFGKEGRKRVLGSMTIGNDRTGDKKKDTGNYNVWATNDLYDELPHAKRKADFRVENFARSKGFWALVAKCAAKAEKK